MTIAAVVDQDHRPGPRAPQSYARVGSDGIEVCDVDDHPVGDACCAELKCNPLFFTPHRADHGVSRPPTPASVKARRKTWQRPGIIRKIFFLVLFIVSMAYSPSHCLG